MFNMVKSDQNTYERNYKKSADEIKGLQKLQNQKATVLAITTHVDQMSAKLNQAYKGME